MRFFVRHNSYFVTKVSLKNLKNQVTCLSRGFKNGKSHTILIFELKSKSNKITVIDAFYINVIAKNKIIFRYLIFLRLLSKFARKNLDHRSYILIKICFLTFVCESSSRICLWFVFFFLILKYE